MSVQIIRMGLNTEPPNSPYNYDNQKAVDLEQQIHNTLEEHGQCELSWSCEGRTRHEMHARQWEKHLESKGYKFEIDYNYGCKVTKA